MNILYEEDGHFKVGSILTDNTTSLQVENSHGKRSKVKASNVLLRFTQPGLDEFLPQAERIAGEIEVDFLWEFCPTEEFAFDALAAEYFGHPPSPLEAAGTLLRLHSSPIHFHRKGKGRFRAAPAETLKAALAGLEKKRQQAELQARYSAELESGKLPAEFLPLLPRLLYHPDRNSIEAKALEAACAATRLSPAHLLQRCGALPSAYDYHRNKFLFEHFPRGTGFPPLDPAPTPELPLATVQAFSIDDATTTEIDDAFSLTRLSNGNWQVGIHIAVPALGIPPDSALDALAAGRLSTVYIPGDKITMLPDALVADYTLTADRACPALSLYLELAADTLEVLHSTSRVERVHIAANLRHDTLEPLFNEDTLAAGKTDYPWAAELRLLWQFAQKLEALRGKPADNNVQQNDYVFHVENDRVTITLRRRGSPIDKLVSELMILVNSSWGKLLADHQVAGIYRTKMGGKVKMSTVPAPHQGLGVAHYLWSSSPLRRYVDLVNQRQILSVLHNETPVYAKNDTRLYAILRDFDAAYTAYNDFQRQMERYWCLRWLQQEQVRHCTAQVLRENLVRLEAIPLTGRIASLPGLPPGSRIELELGAIDLLDLDFEARHTAILEEAATGT